MVTNNKNAIAMPLYPTSGGGVFPFAKYGIKMKIYPL
jgi:hypothetical protein